MYPVSNAYKEAMHSRVQSFRVSGTVGNVSFTDENILSGSLSITNQCSDSDSIGIGQVYIGELNCTSLKLDIDRNNWYGKDVTIYFGQQLADKTYEDIPLGVFTISEAEYTASGVSYTNAYLETAQTAFAITVGQHTLTGLSITPPAKSAYKYGETIDYTGLVVTAEYSDGINEDVTENASISPSNGSIFTNNEDVTVLVSYTDLEGVTATGSFVLNCNSVSALNLVFAPIKTTYITGQRTSYTGCLIRAAFEDGSNEDVTALCVFSPASGTVLSTLGTQTVTATYAQITVNFNVTVISNFLRSMNITDTNTSICGLDDTWDFSGVSVEGVYADGSKRDITALCTFSPASGTVINEDGDIPINVQCEGVSGVFYREIVGDTAFLNYVNYTQSGNSIKVTGLNFSRIMSDNPSDIVIYSKIMLDNKVYDVVIDD